MMYKRPIARPRWNVPTALPGGGVVSRCSATPVIPSGHPSFVGQIIDKIRQGSFPTGPKETAWTPPVNHEFLAKHLADPVAFTKRCEAWHAQNASTAPVVVKPEPPLNLAPVVAVYEKWGSVVPPIAEREKAWRLAGYSEAKIQKALAHHRRMEETADARQEALDLIFAKFPSANKPTPKTKTKKVIKVVKKKMTGSINE